MVKLLSEECNVRREKICGESILVCFTPKEKCPKQEYYPDVKVILGEISAKCMK